MNEEALEEVDYRPPKDVGDIDVTNKDNPHLGRRKINMNNLREKLDDLANEFNIPSITEWKQGKFLDSPKYDHMGERWKYDQKEREESLIRPGGGTNNALFQVTRFSSPEEITEYLEALGKLLKEQS